MSDLPPDHVPDGWGQRSTESWNLDATLESTDDVDVIETTLIVGIVGPPALTVGALIAAPFAGWAFRLFTWAAGL